MHTEEFPNIEQSTKLTINQKTAGRVCSGPLSQLEKLHDLCTLRQSFFVVLSEGKKYSNSFRIPTTNLPSAQKIEISYHLGFWFMFGGQSFSVVRCISLHCTTQILLLQRVSSGTETVHAGNCRRRISFHMLHTLFYEAVKQSDLR